ncbi:hypothetical protein MTQ01_01540 [Streptomyces sp. XM4193]|uniref:hypothetical protein n=1 Tax=Streptomyces sp. XM4193 TaxID=2929782 RepID=UPI001FF8DC95|nr:hypothetical protein [Streptomyces sp. XM4193]MCK1794729.1 hypothetical protein [Streptomyces sp. XM4193]
MLELVQRLVSRRAGRRVDRLGQPPALPTQPGRGVRVLRRHQPLRDRPVKGVQPLRGDDCLLVRPYVLAQEREDRREDRAFCRLLRERPYVVLVGACV